MSGNDLHLFCFPDITFVVSLVKSGLQPFWTAAALHDGDGTRPCNAWGTSDLMFLRAAPLLCWSGSGGGTKMRPGFSRDWGLLAACAVLCFFQLSDFIRLSRKSWVASVGEYNSTAKLFPCCVGLTPLARRSLSLQIILHPLSPIATASFPGCG